MRCVFLEKWYVYREVGEFGKQTWNKRSTDLERRMDQMNMRIFKQFSLLLLLFCLFFFSRLKVYKPNFTE